jgi:hypothetical protein
METEVHKKWCFRNSDGSPDKVTGVYVAFLSHSKEFPSIVPRLNYERFLPNRSQFIWHPTMGQCTMKQR